MLVKISVALAVPPSATFAQVNDFHNWAAWNPWAKIDPQMKHTYGGAPAGSGAVYSWSGNREVGEGRMKALRGHQHRGVHVQARGRSDKAIHLFVDMDAMIGGNFEKGLAQLKSIVETGGGQR